MDCPGIATPGLHERREETGGRFATEWRTGGQNGDALVSDMDGAMFSYKLPTARFGQPPALASSQVIEPIWTRSA